jgi:hypothetical protein
MTIIRTYSELRRLETFEDRFHYLSLRGKVGDATFGFDRWINQQFYTGREWRRLRSDIIVRDNGCDLGIDGYELHERIIIHHMNPLSVDDLVHGDDAALNPEYLISVSHQTHNAIHYGDERLLRKPLVPRRPGDTRLW